MTENTCLRRGGDGARGRGGDPAEAKTARPLSGRPRPPLRGGAPPSPALPLASAPRETLILAHMGAARRIAQTAPRPTAGIDPEELVSEGYVALVQAVDTWSPEKGPLPTWVARCVRHRTRDWLRKEDWVPRSVRNAIADGQQTAALELVPLPETDGEEPFAIPDPAPGPEALCLEDAARAAVRRALDGLPERARLVIERHYWDGASKAAIAQEIHRSPSTVTHEHQAALALLQAALGPEAAEGKREKEKGKREKGTRKQRTERPPFWTPAENRTLRALWLTTPRGEIARRTGRTRAAVQAQARRLGLTPGGGPP